uniref:Uncharacterized protein n=1 Tax=Physcomitrium patens TaxID=3218 RepID=A0A2K1KQB7_PHYPA|nr:hypothetical protein PHYPA_006862 [Physcomitrium patens]
MFLMAFSLSGSATACCSNHRLGSLLHQHSQLHTWMEVCLQKGYNNLFNHFPYLFSSRSKVSLKSSLEQLPSNFIDAGRV